MQLQTTAEVFHVTLKSFFVIASLISEYTLAFDQWIVTPPTSSDDSSGQRKRWISVLKTSLAYAVIEPLMYCMMAATSDMAPWWLLMACLFHTEGVLGSVLLMSELVQNVVQKHNEICGDPKVDLAMEKGEANEPSEKTAARATLSLKAWEQHDEEASPPPKVNISQCMDKHPLPKLYPLTILLPVATAAMINAGLLYYTRYLDSPDSQKWFGRFAFGWIVIALLCACLLILGRWCNYMIHESSGRPKLTFIVPWEELKYRLVALSLMTLVRGIVRILLSQDPLAWFSYSPDTGIALIGTLDIKDGMGSGPGPRKHLLDRVLGIIPPWVGTTISIGSCVCIWGNIFYTRWQERRQRRQTGD